MDANIVEYKVIIPYIVISLQLKTAQLPNRTKNLMPVELYCPENNKFQAADLWWVTNPGHMLQSQRYLSYLRAHAMRVEL